MTWVANVLVLVGLYLVGGRRRSAFLFTAAGETLWTAAGVVRGEFDLAAICAVFAVLAVVNWWRWGAGDART